MLFRKLLRTMRLYRAQFISMIIMIALGIGTFVGFNVEWYSLEQDTGAFLSDTGFADYRLISEQGFSEADAAAIAALDGVDAVSRVLTVNVLREDGDVLALTVTENPAVSGFLLTSGVPYDAESPDGLWLSDRYAAANGLAVGDTLTLRYKNLEITGTVRGLVKSGEYLICVPDETQLMPNYNTYGYAYLSPAMLQQALGAAWYTQLNVLSTLDRTQMAARADEALGRTPLLLGKDDTISYAEAMGESEEGKTMAAILPVLFLAIAVLTMVTTMHRLTVSEKPQIGTLKSLGFKDRRILRHYCSYAAMIGLVGTALGIGLGWWLGWFIMNPDGSMGTYLDMPSWALSAPPFVWAVLVGINVFLIGIGYLSVKSMLRGTAADALRPYTPKKVRATLLERTPLWDRLSFGARWNLRDCLRHKARTGMTLFGIIGCMVLIVAALGMQDTMDEFMASFYQKSIRYETRINLDPETTARGDALAIAAQYDADACAQSSVQVHGRTLGLEIYRIEHDQVRFLAAEGDGYVTLGGDGVWICERIARDEGLAAGDSLVFSPYGQDRTYTVRVAGVVRSLTESVILSESYAETLAADDGSPLAYQFNVLYTAQTEIAPDPHILNTQSKQSIVDSFDTFMDIMTLMVWLLIAVSVILGIVVLYNLGVMSYTERYREMATLKVIGFKDRQIGRLLIGQNLWLTLIGMLIGLPAGILTLRYLLTALASEYELRLSLGWRTFVFSSALIFGVSILVSLMIARKNRKINMVEALKGQDA